MLIFGLIVKDNLMIVYLYWMFVGIVRVIFCLQDLIVELVIFKFDNVFVVYGLVGKYDVDGFFVLLVEGDIVDKVKGIYVCLYLIILQLDMVCQVGIDKNFLGDVMKCGYMMVNVGVDVLFVKKGGVVYIVVLVDVFILVLFGGIMVVEVIGKIVVLFDVFFMGVGDVNGNVEIFWKI